MDCHPYYTLPSYTVLHVAIILSLIFASSVRTTLAQHKLRVSSSSHIPFQARAPAAVEAAACHEGVPRGNTRLYMWLLVSNFFPLPAALAAIPW
jgi:hypothetical protein